MNSSPLSPTRMEAPEIQSSLRAVLQPRHWRLHAIFALAMLVALTSGAYLYKSLQTVAGHRYWVDHTYDVLRGLGALSYHLNDAESGQRGFTLTGEEAYLEPYNSSRLLIAKQLQQIKNLIADNPTQQRRLAELESRIDEHMRWHDAVIAMNRTKGKEAAQQLLQQGRGKELADKEKQLLAAAGDDEIRLLDARNNEVNQSWSIAQSSLILVFLLNVIMISVAYYLLRRHLQIQAKDNQRLADDYWLQKGLSSLADVIAGDPSLTQLADRAMAFMARYAQMDLGAFYVFDGVSFRLHGGYALGEKDRSRRLIARDEGLLGAAAREQKVLCVAEVPDGYFKVNSSLGEVSPRHLLILPVLHEGRVKGAVEIASLTPLTGVDRVFYEAAMPILGTAVVSAQARQRLQDLLEETQRQAEELQQQQEELRVSNEELENQGQALQQAKERLQMQQEILQQTNEELEQQTRALERQKEALGERNTALQHSQQRLEQKMHELEMASRYKSEFMANMSHELRTPLNSMLILATLLSENKEGRLAEKQVEFARTIYRSGNDLLSLINDILDLSKVEAGKLELALESYSVEEMAQKFTSEFQHMVASKGLGFQVTVDEEAPRQVTTDRRRLEQVLKNFIANAVKFTEQGSVHILFQAAVLPKTHEKALAIAVKDTGIGIPVDKQKIIFEAFQQGDGSTSRQYGGTGLGLTISRELAHVLGGVISLQSAPGQGSCFTLTLPLTWTGADVRLVAKTVDAERVVRGKVPIIKGEQDSGVGAYVMEAVKPEATLVSLPPASSFDANDRLILLVEDDVDFANLLAERAREHGFKTLQTASGEGALHIAANYPVKGVLLDIKLPDSSGLSVLERLKDNPRTRHLPVHVISGLDYMKDALKMGAVGYVLKPAALEQLTKAFERVESVMFKAVKRVLVIEDDLIQREAICQLLGGNDIVLDTASTGGEAQQKLEHNVYDCLILDLRLPDMSGLELLERLSQNPQVQWTPVVVYTGKDLSSEEEASLRRYSESIIIKGAKSPERLLDEVTLFLHCVETQLPADTQAILRSLRTKERHLEGRNVLLVDDDMRNVFALSNALENHGMRVRAAKNGREAVDILEGDAADRYDLVLMDIMMPQMDGYEAMRHIRQHKRFANLPIIALTAKAMRGDQERCLAAGANDYLPKPIVLGQMLSLLRVWMPKNGGV